MISASLFAHLHPFLFCTILQLTISIMPVQSSGFPYSSAGNHDFFSIAFVVASYCPAFRLRHATQFQKLHCFTRQVVWPCAQPSSFSWAWNQLGMNISHVDEFEVKLYAFLTLILLTWRIWWAPNNASRWQMGFNSAFKELIRTPNGGGWSGSLCSPFFSGANPQVQIEWEDVWYL